MKKLLSISIRRTVKTIVAVSCLLLAFCVSFGGKAVAEPTVLKMAIFEPPQGYNTRNYYKPFADKLNSTGSGVLKVDFFPGGILGRSPLQQLKILKDGVSDIALIVNAYHPGQLVDDQIANTPFMAKDSRHCTRALDKMLNKNLLRGYEDLVVLSHICLDQYIIHSNFPIKTPSDLKGKKLRTAGKMHHALAQAIGAVPIGMPITKTAEGLTRRVIDAVVVDYATAATFRIVDVAKYHIEVPLGTTTIMLAMMKDRYNGLSDKARAVIDNQSGLKTSLVWAGTMDTHSEIVINKVRKNPKHTIYKPTASEMAQWKRVLQPVVDSWHEENDHWPSLIKGYKAGLQ